MIAAHLALSLALAATEWLTRSDGPLVGQATYYNAGVMEQAAANRRMDLGPFVGGVALNRRGDLGRAVWLEHEGEFTGPYLVVDVAALHHYPDRLRQGYVAEVPYWLAEEWGMVGIGPAQVTVHFRRVPEGRRW